MPQTASRDRRPPAVHRPSASSIPAAAPRPIEGTAHLLPTCIAAPPAEQRPPARRRPRCRASKTAASMEQTGATYSIEDEDHTLANALRFFLNKK